MYVGLLVPLSGVMIYIASSTSHQQELEKYEKACRDAYETQKQARAAQGSARSLGAVEIKVFEDQLREMKADIESN